jgi:hypothetical protein
LKWGKPWYNPVRFVERDSGNQTYFTIEKHFSNLNFYEFVSDQYAKQWDHNFEGRPNSNKTELREIME